MPLDLIKSLEGVGLYDIVVTIVFVIAFSLFLEKGGIELVKKPLLYLYNKMKGSEDREVALQDKLKALEDSATLSASNIGALASKVDLLIGANKENIRGELLDKYTEYYCNQRSVPIHQLEAIERKYNTYKQLGGNSFVHHLVEDLRSLPVTSIRECDNIEDRDK